MFLGTYDPAESVFQVDVGNGWEDVFGYSPPGETVWSISHYNSGFGEFNTCLQMSSPTLKYFWHPCVNKIRFLEVLDAGQDNGKLYIGFISEVIGEEIEYMTDFANIPMVKIKLKLNNIERIYNKIKEEK